MAYENGKAIPSLSRIPPFRVRSKQQLTTALTFLSRAAAASATGTKIDTAIEFEPIHVKIHLDGLGAFEELFIDNVLITVDFKPFIGVIWLIQSHGQAGAASTALVQKNTNRPYLFITEICRDLFGGRRCYFKHNILLEKFGLQFACNHWGCHCKRRR